MQKISRELENIGISSILAMNKTKPEAYAVPQRAANLTLEAMGGPKVPKLDLKKTPPERELSLNEMPNELRLYVSEHPKFEKVFNQPGI